MGLVGRLLGWFLLKMYVLFRLFYIFLIVFLWSSSPGAPLAATDRGVLVGKFLSCVSSRQLPGTNCDNCVAKAMCPGEQV